MAVDRRCNWLQLFLFNLSLVLYSSGKASCWGRNIGSAAPIAEELKLIGAMFQLQSLMLQNMIKGGTKSGVNVSFREISSHVAFGVWAARGLY
jgi:hypothetical protein